MDGCSRPAASRPWCAILEGWTEPGSATNVINPLTALGHGDLAWAGYFDNVENRLGFYDGTLDTDQVSGPITYQVSGWYSDPTLDPLGDQAVDSYTAFLAKLAALGWGLDTTPLPAVARQAAGYQATAAALNLPVALHPNIAANARMAARAFAPWWPTACVLHGSVVGISWPDADDTVEVGGPPAADSIKVAVGTTMGDTLGTLIARANAQPNDAAIVEALQLGVVRELDAPDGRARLDVQLHASGFVALPGEAPSKETVTIAPSGPPPAPAAPPASARARTFRSMSPAPWWWRTPPFPSCAPSPR